ncbi:hypothetical protein [Streptomyces phaeochromogenes]|uniref:hypothetical protein n=1 Tax=Streptomyces phaeochromogenes TaxID=1923 RepID=UPI002E12EC92|nr:hypothetical protein OG437_29140 [Streptomyces phaeochromogenes]
MVGLRKSETRWLTSVQMPVSPSCCLAWVVLGALIALVALANFMVDDGCANCGPPFPPNPQRTYVEEIKLARQQLFEVEVYYTRPSLMELVADAEPREFRVEIPAGLVRPASGESQTIVNAGAQIGVKLHCSGAGVRCTRLSSERQNVLSKGDSGTWVWSVSAQSAGKVNIALTMTSYYRDSDTVLAEKPPVMLHVDAAAPHRNPWFSWAEDLWRWVNGTLTGLGTLAMSVSAIAAVIAMAVRRRRTAGDPDDADPPAPALGDGRRPQVRPMRQVPLRLGRPRRQSTVARRPRNGADRQHRE